MCYTISMEDEKKYTCCRCESKVSFLLTVYFNEGSMAVCADCKKSFNELIEDWLDMRVFKMRQKLGRRGLLLLEHGTGWLVTNNGTVKTLIQHEFDDLDAVEAWMEKLPNRLTDEESEVFDEEFKTFVKAQDSPHYLHACQIIEGWPKWRQDISKVWPLGNGT